MKAYVLIVLSAVVCVSTTAAAEAYSTRFEGEENPLSDGGKWRSISPIGSGNTRWMSQGKFGIFMHYQYRILLGYSVRTKPQFPNPSQMTAEGWNRFNQFRDQELMDWINTCNSQGGVCTLDWPFDPRTGRLKEFGIAQLKRVRQVVNKD